MVMTTDDVIRHISQKLRHYLEVQRREEGFVVSGKCKKELFPSAREKEFSALHERSIRHLLKSQQAHKILTYLENWRLSVREKQVKSALIRYMNNGDVSCSTEIPPQGAKNDLSQNPPRVHEFLGSVPRAEAERLITMATKLYVATEMLISNEKNYLLEERKKLFQETINNNCLRDRLLENYVESYSLQEKPNITIQKICNCQKTPKVKTKKMKVQKVSSPIEDHTSLTKDVKENSLTEQTPSISKDVKDSSCQTEDWFISDHKTVIETVIPDLVDEVSDDESEKSSSYHRVSSSICLSENSLCDKTSTERKETSDKESTGLSDIESGVHVLSYNSSTTKLHSDDGRHDATSTCFQTPIFDRVKVSPPFVMTDSNEDSNYCDDSYSDDERSIISETEDLSESENEEAGGNYQGRDNEVDNLQIKNVEDNNKCSRNDENSKVSENIVEVASNIGIGKGNSLESQSDENSCTESSSDVCSTCEYSEICNCCSCDGYQENEIQKISNNESSDFDCESECSACNCSCSADDENNDSDDVEEDDDDGKNGVSNQSDTQKPEKVINQDDNSDDDRKIDEEKIDDELSPIEKFDDDEKDKSEEDKIPRHPYIMPRQLTTESVDSNILDEETKKLSIHDAVRDGNLSLVEMLSKGNRRFIETVDDRGWTPIHLAAAINQVEIVKFLALEGAHVSALDASGHTAIHTAAMRGHKDCVQALLEAEANVDCVTSDGFTPLHLAVLNNHIECCKIILTWGAKADKEDALGRTVHDMAEEFSLKEVQKLLNNFQRQLDSFSSIMDTMKSFSDKKTSKSSEKPLSRNILHFLISIAANDYNSN